MESTPDLFQPLSTTDTLVIRLGLIAPWLGVAAAVVLLVAVAVFAFRTRERGRIEIFLGAVLFAAEFFYFVSAYRELAFSGSLVREAMMRILGVIPLLLIAVGFTRLTLAAVRRRRSPAAT